MSNKKLKIALQSRGKQLYEPSIKRLEEAGYTFDGSDKRRYSFPCETDPNIEFILRKASDIPTFVNDGSIELGITGHDWIRECRADEEDVEELMDLKFGACRLVLAVPEEWEDVDSIVDLFIKMKSNRRPLRVYTEYVALTREFLYGHGLKNFRVRKATGAMESLPRLEADIIADLVSTGHTLQANRLKEISGGTILRSTARLICNKNCLKDEETSAKIKEILDNIESAMRARDQCMVTANLIAKDEKEIIRKLKKLKKRKITGLAGPTISPVYVINPKFEELLKNDPRRISDDAKYKPKIWAVNLVIKREERFKAVEELRKIGCSGILLFKPDFLYEEKSEHYDLIKKRKSK